MFLHLTIEQNVALTSTEGVGLLATLELICLWKDLLKRTSWQAKTLELVEKEQLQLTTLLTGSLTWFTAIRFFYDSTFTRKFTRTFNYGITTSNRFLITLCTGVVRRTGGTEGTVTDEWQDLIQDFTLGAKTLTVKVGNI